MVAELTALRDQIDEVDKALLELLAKRLELVAEVGEVKSQYGLPIYVPERESAMLASRRGLLRLGSRRILSKMFCVVSCGSLIPAKTIKVLKRFIRTCVRW